MMNDEHDDLITLNLVMCPGISERELQRQLRARDHWHGLPIVPPGHEVQIIQLRGRWEPDIEDTP